MHPCGFPGGLQAVMTLNGDGDEKVFGALLTSDWQPKYTAGVLAP
jgi:hypothetical protein